MIALLSLDLPSKPFHGWRVVTLRGHAGVVESYPLVASPGGLRLGRPRVRRFPAGTAFAGDNQILAIPDGTRVALVSELRGRSQLHVLDAATLAERWRGDAAGTAFLSWSPKSDAVLLHLFNRGLRVARSGGRGRALVRKSVQSLVWSRDGSGLFMNSDTAWPFRWKKNRWTYYGLVSASRPCGLAQVLAGSWIGRVPPRLRNGLGLAPDPRRIWRTTGVFVPYFRALGPEPGRAVDLVAGTGGVRAFVRATPGYTGIGSISWDGGEHAAYVQGYRLFGAAEAANRDLWFGEANLRSGRTRQWRLIDGTSIDTLHFALAKG